MAVFKTHDAYLAALPPDQQALLGHLRHQLGQHLPQATEVISYAMPGYRIGKKVIAGYAGFAKHCGFYPHSGGIIPGFAAELDRLGFKHSKSGVLFTPTNPLPADLLERIVAARLVEAGVTV
jgi:uncharacterized protein YdhG (YjbR/CyaY superfamily)